MRSEWLLRSMAVQRVVPGQTVVSTLWQVLKLWGLQRPWVKSKKYIYICIYVFVFRYAYPSNALFFYMVALFPNNLLIKYLAWVWSLSYTPEDCSGAGSYDFWSERPTMGTLGSPWSLCWVHVSHPRWASGKGFMKQTGGMATVTIAAQSWS